MAWSLKPRPTRKLTEIAPLGTYRLGTPIFGHFSALMLWESAADFFLRIFSEKRIVESCILLQESTARTRARSVSGRAPAHPTVPGRGLPSTIWAREIQKAPLTF